MTFAWHHPNYYKKLEEEEKKRNPVARTLPEHKHKVFKDKTKYNRKKLKVIV